MAFGRMYFVDKSEGKLASRNWEVRSNKDSTLLGHIKKAIDSYSVFSFFPVDSDDGYFDADDLTAISNFMKKEATVTSKASQRRELIGKLVYVREYTSEKHQTSISKT